MRRPQLNTLPLLFCITDPGAELTRLTTASLRLPTSINRKGETRALLTHVQALRHQLQVATYSKGAKNQASSPRFSPEDWDRPQERTLFSHLPALLKETSFFRRSGERAQRVKHPLQLYTLMLSITDHQKGHDSTTSLQLKDEKCNTERLWRLWLGNLT